MKVKHVMSIFALSALMGLGAFAGAKIAKKDFKKAVAADDKMFSIVIDLADAVGYTDFHRPEVEYRIGETKKYSDLHQLSGTYYTVNIPFDSEAQEIDSVRFLFKQTNDVDKWSNVISLTPSHQYVYHFAFQNTWTGDNWDVEKDTWSGVPRMRGDDIGDTYFTADVSSLNYKVTVTLNPNKTYQIFYGKWGFGAIRQTSIDSYLDEYSLNSFTVKEAGTYDIIAYNNYSDGGIFEFKQHYDPNETYIYYVLENNTPTNDYIYTWGGNEQFGAWPGTKVTEVTGVQEVTGDGVLHFQGSETARLIYKIPVKIGYPIGDEYFKFNNNNDWESEQRPINSRSAYWYTGSANGNAASAIDFLVRAENIRNEATGDSVCNISKEDAETLVYSYISLGKDIQETYVDCSKVYTYKEDGSAGNELVSYRHVVEQLSKIAKISLDESRPLSFFNDNNNALLVVVISAGLTIIGVATLLTLKKRKHQ